MSKTTTAAPAAPAAPAVTTTVAQPKPQSLHLIGSTLHVLAQASAHIRAGYVFDTNLPIEVFGAAGTMSFYLVLGDPDAHFVQAAKVATEEAMVQQEAQRQREIEAAAAQLVADRERAAAKAIMDARIAEQEAALAALKAAAAA